MTNSVNTVPAVPKITVVTPVFNAAKYLNRCLDSVACQTHQNVEHIVVDGGSTDGTLDILKNSGARWLSEPDNGMYDAVNKGLALGSGEIVGYLNADDALFPDSLAHVSKAFQSSPDIGFVYGYCTYVDEEFRSLATFKPSPLTARLGCQTRITFAQPTVYWSQKLQLELGVFNPELKTAGDADFFYRLLNGPYRGSLIRRPLASFMVRPDALSATMEREMGREVAGIRSANKISKVSVPYIANEIAFYTYNASSYIRYVWNKRFN